MQNARNMPQMNVRLPEGLKELIKAKADKNHRSLNSEAVYIFEQYVKQEESREQEAKAA